MRCREKQQKLKIAKNYSESAEIAADCKFNFPQLYKLQ